MSDLRRWSYRKEFEERGSLIQKTNRLQQLQQSLTAESMQQFKQTKKEVDDILKRGTLEMEAKS